MLSLQIWMTSWMKQYVAIILHWINTLFCMRVWLWEQVVNLIYRFIYSMNDNHDDDIDCSRSKKAFSHANIDIHWQKLCKRKIYVVSAQKKDMLKAHNMRWGGNNITQNGLQNVVVIFMQNYCQFRKWNFRLFQFQRCETANGLEKYLVRQFICWNKLWFLTLSKLYLEFCFYVCTKSQNNSIIEQKLHADSFQHNKNGNEYT